MVAPYLEKRQLEYRFRDHQFRRKIVDVEYEAIRIAVDAHAGEVNKFNGEPYVDHVHRVAASVKATHNNTCYLSVAWLHDVVEDTDVTSKQIHERFDPFDTDIAVAVDLLTKTSKTIDLQAYYEAIKGNHYARIVKLADIQDNFRRLHHITDAADMVRLARKYSLGIDILAL